MKYKFTDTSPSLRLISKIFLPTVWNENLNFNNPKYADVKFLFDDSNNVIYVHKVILGNKIEYFDQIFSSGLVETKSKNIKISDVAYAIFYTMIYYIYNDCIEYTTNIDEISAIYIAFHK